MRFLFLLPFIAILFVSQNANGQKVISGVTFFSDMYLGGEKLTINGGGLREKYFIDLYVAALYIKTKTKEASTIINNDEPMGITINRILSRKRNKRKTP
jgi:hypothetical protein